MAIHSALVLVFGFLGDFASFLSFLEPAPKFCTVYKKKGTEGLESMPYIAALFSAMLWLFYAYVKTGEMLLLAINAFGCVVETIYLAIYITYCPNKEARIHTSKLILLLNLALFCVIVLVTNLLAEGAAARVKLLRWICVVFTTSADDVVAPLSIIKKVIHEKNVELLSHPSVLRVKVIAAIMRLLYGLGLKDLYDTLPNAVKITFGIVQMVLYVRYRKNEPVKDKKLPEHKGELTNENKREVIDENKNVRHDQEKHETVTIENEKPQEAEEKNQEQPPQNRQGQQTKISEIPPQKMVAYDQTRFKGDNCF